MTLKLVDGGENTMLLAFINKTAQSSDLYMELFTSNTTPADTDVIGTYTLATGFGYAQKQLAGASWTVSGGVATFAAQTWTFTGALGNVYGYLYRLGTSGVLVIAERFTNGPYNVTTNGDTITVNPRIEVD